MALKWEVNDIIKKIHYFSISFGIVLASIISYQVVKLELSSFMTLFITSIVFWGIYGVILFIMKEEMLMQFYGEIRKRYLKK